jgi:hypothetical protein
MVYNPLRDEIMITQVFAHAILTFRGGADGDEAPIRVIMGPNTGLTNPGRLGLDPVHREVFVPQGDKVLVFPSEAEGNVAPIRILQGPDTRLGASSLTIDPVNDLLIVDGSRPGSRGVGQLLIFNRTASGNAKPRNVISGPNTRMQPGDSLVTVYPPRQLILAGAPSSGDEGDVRGSTNNFIGVWSENDSGDVPPRWTIGGPGGVLRQVRGVALDPAHKTVIVSDKFLNAVVTYYFPEIF